MTDVCLLLWLIIVSAVDVVRREVPPWLDLPALGLALACRALGGVRAAALTLVVWAVLFSLWEARVIGGGERARAGGRRRRASTPAAARKRARPRRATRRGSG